MRDHWPDADEQPTPKASLTIVEVRLLPYRAGDVEQPTPRANLTIEVVPAGSGFGEGTAGSVRRVTSTGTGDLVVEAG
jgi:hypothetical protein